MRHQVSTKCWYLITKPNGITTTQFSHLSLNPISRPVFTHGPPGPGPRAANFQGRHIKKIEIEVWYAEKKAVHEREI